MPRTARLVVPGAPHHVTQRGNRRQRTFFSPADYQLYLRIAAEAFPKAGVEVLAYCLMPNHVHLIASPDSADGLSRAVGATHRAYTRHVDRREGWTGFLWQGRFASAPLDEEHLYQCVRYVGLNPVRAQLVARAVDWPWSSVRGHLGLAADWLTGKESLEDRFGWDPVRMFEDDLPTAELAALRRRLASGRRRGAGDTYRLQAKPEHVPDDRA